MVLKDTRCSGAAARLGNCPTHRADQRRPSGCQPRHRFINPLLLKLEHEGSICLRVGRIGKTNRRGRRAFYRLTRGRPQATLQGGDPANGSKTAAIIARFFSKSRRRILNVKFLRRFFIRLFESRHRAEWPTNACEMRSPNILGVPDRGESARRNVARRGAAAGPRSKPRRGSRPIREGHPPAEQSLPFFEKSALRPAVRRFACFLRSPGFSFPLRIATMALSIGSTTCDL